MSNLLVHIGYHKTGTSWLQRRLFVNTGLGWTLSHAKTSVVDPLILPHALDFDAAACRAAFEFFKQGDGLVIGAAVQLGLGFGINLVGAPGAGRVGRGGGAGLQQHCHCTRQQQAGDDR